jgi:sugar-specific transcriptional regulator TrmB
MSLTSLLAPFDLDEKEQEVYIALAKLGWVTILDLSQRCTIKRSTLYRVIERLQTKGLIETQIDENSTYYRTTPVESFGALINEEKKKVQKMEESLESLSSQLKMLQASLPLETSIHFHRGNRGLQVLEYKIIENKNIELLVFGSSQWHTAVGQEFAEEVRAQELVHNIRIREILNPETDCKIEQDGTVYWTKNKEYVLQCYRHRTISRNLLNIANEILILPNSLILYSITEEEVVGIELQAKIYTQMMRQMFESFWEQGQVIDNFGEKFK